MDRGLRLGRIACAGIRVGRVTGSAQDANVPDQMASRSTPFPDERPARPTLVGSPAQPSLQAVDHLVREAEARCRAAQLQFTPLRRRVFEGLAGGGQPLGAYDLVERLGREKRIAPISVYRALDFLIEAGLIHRIATRNTYLPCVHAHHGHDAMVFLVCTRCGHVDEVASPDLARGLDVTAAGAGFKPGGRSVEVEGECASCRRDAAA